MRKTLSSIFIVLFLSFSAQSQENDFQSWHVLTFNKKFNKKTSVALKSAIRLRENSSLFSKSFFDLKIKENINKKFSISSGYRYNKVRNKKLEISNYNRFYSDINYKNKIIKRVSYTIRNRCQIQGDMSGYKTIFRQKFSIYYNIRKTKLSPKIATEYFFSTKESIKKLRSTLTLAFPISKKIDFDLSYRIQHEFYVNNPETLFIFESKFLYNL